MNNKLAGAGIGDNTGADIINADPFDPWRNRSRFAAGDVASAFWFAS